VFPHLTGIFSFAGGFRPPSPGQGRWAIMEPRESPMIAAIYPFGFTLISFMRTR